MAEKQDKGRKRSAERDGKAEKKQRKAEKKSTKPIKPIKPIKPKKVGTGRGASPAEIAAEFASMMRGGKSEDEIWKRLFRRKFISIEGSAGLAWNGIDAVRQKAAAWHSEHRIHSVEVDGPFVGATGFGMRYVIDVEVIASGERIRAEELAVYTVHNGKVVQEEFLGRADQLPAVTTDASASG